MNTTRNRNNLLTAAVGAAIAAVAAPSLVFLGAGTAHAIQDVSEVVAPTVQDVSDTNDVIDPGSNVAILDPGSRVGIIDPGLKVGIGGPDTRPAP